MCLSCAYLVLIFQIHPTGQEPSAAAPQPTRPGIASLSPQAVFSRLLKMCPRARSYCLPSPTEQIAVTQDPSGSEVRWANLLLPYTELIHPFTATPLFSNHLNVFWQTAMTNKCLLAADWSEALGYSVRTDMQFSLTLDNLFFWTCFFLNDASPNYSKCCSGITFSLHFLRTSQNYIWAVQKQCLF